MKTTSDKRASDFAAVHAVACDYLDGMMYADEAKLRRAFHPKCLIVGHFRDRLEYDPLDAFIEACKKEGSIPPGTPYFAEMLSIDVTGDTAVVKLTDDYLGVRFTDYLTMVKTEGRWVIVNKAFYVHAD
ncbi:nuclear transport factor 2 family protein [Dongia deserti]|uniref:nuclear transport factor 2 family protein n=1 Tax=Dongia deserti TaxID=2268030 RepID=UPI000E65A5B7|nr:nuclear transport factor 2 family protein [Dongia deserti]